MLCIFLLEGCTMIMELPHKFRMRYAEVINGELLIYENVRFEDLMYELTYVTKKHHCYYCDKKLKKETRTIDHAYPRDAGGISIVNNLYPSCSSCNSAKGNLTRDEYFHFLKLRPKEQKQYRKEVLENRDYIFHERGFALPRKWFTMVDICSIDYQIASTELRGKRYYRILEFYNKYHKMPRPAILDKNMRLLDGYNCVLFARDHGLREIPVIILENVTLIM